MLALRGQVKGMEEWVAHLLRRKPNLHEGVDNSTRQRSEASDQQDAAVVLEAAASAMEEFQKRQQSESLNHALKRVLVDQVKVKDAILTILHEMPPLSEADRGCLSSLPMLLKPSPILRVDNSPVIIDQLAEQVSRLYLDCDSVFPRRHMPSFGCKMQPTSHKYLGRMMEIVAKAPVSCSMQQASEMLWQELSTVRIYPDKVYRYITSKGSNAVVKAFDMTLRSGRGTTDVNGLQFMKKFEELDRIIHVRAYKLLLPTEGVHLRGHAWTIISNSPADSSHQSDVQFYLQLFMESDSGFSAQDKDIKYIQDVGLTTWSLMMRSYSVFLQELVVEKAVSRSVSI
ncbi:uncharacterized protein IUM83_10811 [Phytophthora cinnamomi]|uniref:uncharacterized protein n=1 Tax=Phytophthora cinnamomi TaxID=4785 RepID=UPI00355A48E8|nr:hypothetical protein IUM83_10811 [Phytophthora cinnamomi]